MDEIGADQGVGSGRRARLYYIIGYRFAPNGDQRNQKQPTTIKIVLDEDDRKIGDLYSRRKA